MDGNLDLIIQSINGRVDRNLEEIHNLSKEIHIGGWVALWGGWQMFKYRVSDRCNVLKGVAVKPGIKSDMIYSGKSTIFIVQLKGDGLVFDGEGRKKVLGDNSFYLIEPERKFTLATVNENAEFVMTVFPFMSSFDTIMDAGFLNK